MSDLSPKKTRSPINALRLINELRTDSGLPKIGAKPKTIKITAEIKAVVLKQVVTQLVPDALTKVDFQLNDKQTKDIISAVAIRLEKIKSGKETAPLVTEKTPLKNQTNKVQTAKATASPTKAKATEKKTPALWNPNNKK